MLLSATGHRRAGGWALRAGAAPKDVRDQDVLQSASDNVFAQLDESS